jgi:hypothetical protein
VAQCGTDGKSFASAYITMTGSPAEVSNGRSRNFEDIFSMPFYSSLKRKKESTASSLHAVLSFFMPLANSEAVKL